MASFRKRNGTWEYRIRYKDVYTGKTREKSKGGFAKKSDAQEAVNKIELSLSEGFMITSDNPAFEPFLYRWLENAKVGLADGTKFQYEKSIKRISKALGNIPLKSINLDIISKYLNDKAQDNYSHSAITSDLTVIHKAIKFAIQQHYFHENPIDGIEIPKTKPKKPSRYWSLDDLDKFIKLQTAYIEKKKSGPQKWYLVGIRDLAIYCTLAGTGARVGELCALYVDSYDPLTATLKLHNNLVSTTYAGLADDFKRNPTMKTSSSYREVPVPSMVSKYLDNWLDVRSDFLKLFHVTNDDGSMFPSPFGNRPIVPVTVRAQLKAICDRFKLKSINVHGFRHTYASFLLQASVPPKQAQVLLGHKKIQTTLDIYTHVSDSDKRKAVDLLDAYLNSPS